MCGIVCYFSDKHQKDDWVIIEKVIYNSKIRGIHSFGFSFIENGIIVTKKFFDIDDAMKSLLSIKPNKFIYHNRYSTSGDYKVASNNQPITINDKSICLNGVVSMATKYENEKKYLINLETDNDAEIILKRELSNKQLISYSGSIAMVMISGGEFYFFRNKNRPAKFAKIGGKIIASTKDILTRSGVKEVYETPEGELLKVSEL